MNNDYDMGFIWFDWWLKTEIENHPAWNPKRERAYLRAKIIKKRSDADVLKWLNMEFANDLYIDKTHQNNNYVVEEISMTEKQIYEIFGKR